MNARFLLVTWERHSPEWRSQVRAETDFELLQTLGAYLDLVIRGHLKVAATPIVGYPRSENYPLGA